MDTYYPLKHTFMKRSFILHRISAFAFSMLPFGIALENKLWLGLISIATILPLAFILINAVATSRRGQTSFISNFNDYNCNLIDILIACLGIINCLAVGLYTLSLIWIVSLSCIFIDLYLKRNKKRSAY